MQWGTPIAGSIRMCADTRTATEWIMGRGRRRHVPCPYGASLRVLMLVLACFFLPIAHALAQEESPEEKGLRIAREASARNDGFKDFTAEMTMVIRDRHGRESVRQMRFKVLEVPEDGDKSLFVFDRPADVRGTALLTHAHINAQDDQWLYLPALKRVKRINAAKRSGSFMGSEFSYEDMSSLEVEEYTYKYLRDEPCGALDCTVIEQTPLDGNSGYSRKLVWQDTVELRTWKMELYDRKGSHLKTLTLADYRQFLDRFWRAGEQTMVNHLTGASTVLEWTSFQFQTDLADSEFTRTALQTRALMRVGGAVAALVFMVASSAGAHALDFSGDLTLEGRWYPQSPVFPGQRSGTAGLVLKPTLYEEVAQSTAVSVSLFYRYDSADSQRTHADLREAHLLTYGDWDESSWELRMGLYRVFWGMAEDVLDFGLSAFVGTSREPSFLVSQRSRPPPTTDSPLIPSYEQIRQFGVDAQLTTEPWLYEMEAIHRSGARNLLGHKEDYSAFILGVERTLYALFDSDADLTLLAEWHYDAVERAPQVSGPMTCLSLAPLRLTTWTAPRSSQASRPTSAMTIVR